MLLTDITCVTIVTCLTVVACVTVLTYVTIVLVTYSPRGGHINIPTSQTKAILRNQAFARVPGLKEIREPHQIHET